MTPVAPDDLLVYTCITGGYDDLQPVASPEPGVAYVCVTDAPIADPRGWRVLRLPQSFDSPVLANRFAKMHPHLLFPEYRRSIYIDGNVQLKSGVKAFADEALREHAMALFAHPFRDCIYAEATECAAIGHDWLWRFARHMRHYRAEGMPQHWGLYECNILVREHADPEVVRLMELWWDELRQGPWRDQLSLPYLLWKTGFRVQSLGMSQIRTGNPHFGMRIEHKPATRVRNRRGRLNRKMLRLLKFAAFLRRKRAAGSR
jgi:hypothetical protein